MQDYLTDAPADHNHLPNIDLDRSLTAIQLGRRLQKITKSMDCFFHSQIERLQNALTICRREVDRADAVQEMIASFAEQKQRWETERDVEIARLDQACAQLTAGWKQLEDARRCWLAERATRKLAPVDGIHVDTENAAWSSAEPSRQNDEESQTHARELSTNELESLRQAMLQHRNRPR